MSKFISKSNQKFDFTTLNINIAKLFYNFFFIDSKLASFDTYNDKQKFFDILYYEKNTQLSDNNNYSIKSYFSENEKANDVISLNCLIKSSSNTFTYT